MARKIIGTKVEAPTGTTILLPNDTQRASAAVTNEGLPGRVVAIGGWVGSANGSARDNMRWGMVNTNPATLTPTSLLAQTRSLLTPSDWSNDVPGGSNVEETLWWTPDQLSPIGWFIAGDITGVANGGAVTTWPNSMGGGSLSQTVAAEKPLYIANGINGHPVVRFDGVDDDMTATITVPAAVSMFIVMRGSKRTTSDQRVYNSPSNRHIFRYYPASPSASLYQTNTSVAYGYNSTYGLITGGEVEIHAHIYGQGTGNARGALFGRNAYGSVGGGADVTTITLGSTGTALWADVEIAEWIIIPSVVSLADQQRVEGYLAHKYGLAEKLQSSHPYYQRRPTYLEPTTNLLLNPSAENDTVTVGAAAMGAATLTKDPAQARLGAASFKLVTPGTAIHEGIHVFSASLNLTGAPRVYTGSVFVRGTATVEVWTRVSYTDATLTEGAKTTFAMSNTAWSRVIPASVTADPAKTISIVAVHVRTNSAQASTFYVDLAQVEEKPYATPYADGYMSDGYAWTGTENNSASTREAGVPHPPQAAIIAANKQFHVVHTSEGIARSALIRSVGRKAYQKPNATINAIDMTGATELSSNLILPWYAVIEENRPPEITAMSPGDDTTLITHQPTFSITVKDPDRDEGYGDYPAEWIIRAWRKKSGEYFFLDSKRVTATAPGSEVGDVTLTNQWTQLWNPKAFSDKLAAWFDATQITGVADGATVAQLDDLSVWGNHATQATASLQPTYRTAGPGGLPTLDFDGGDRLDSLLSQNATDETIFAVVDIDTLSRYHSIIGGDGGENKMLRLSSTNGYVEFYDFSPVTLMGFYDVATPVDTTTIVSASNTGRAGEAGVNGTWKNRGHTGVSFPSTLKTTIGFRGTESLDGQLSELLVFRPALTMQERQQVEGYLAHKYGRTAALASTHPYKTVVPTVFSPLPVVNFPVTAVGPKAWFRADELITSPPANGGTVTTWNDRSGNSLNATQSVEADKPIFRTKHMNNMNGVEFVSTDRLNTNLTASSLDETIFAVVTPAAQSIDRSIVGPQATGGREFVMRSTGEVAILKRGSGTPLGQSTVKLTIGAPAIVGATIRDTTVATHVNGVDETDTHSQTFTASVLSQIGATEGTASPWQGMIYEILSFPALSPADCDRVEGYLAHRWGLTGNLPSDHPYKTVSPLLDNTYGWTAEVRDEIGGISGTAHGGKSEDSDAPDGTTDFDVSTWGYMTVPVGSQPEGRVVTLTPPYLNRRYTHLRSGVVMDYYKVRILKMNSDGVYVEEQSTDAISAGGIVPNTTTTTRWRDLNFAPLEWGAKYAVEWQTIDAHAGTSDWVGRTYFETNATPEQSVVTSPKKGTATTGLPLITFAANDADDDPDTWFTDNNYGVYNSQWNASSSGSGVSQIIPQQMFVAANGNIYVNDSNNGRLIAFTPAGVYSSHIAAGVTTWGAARNNSGDIFHYYPSTSGATETFVMEKFNASHLLQWSVTNPAIGSGRMAATFSWVFIASTAHDTIRRYSQSTGAFSLSIGTPGYGPGQFKYPHGIAADPTEQWIYVAEQGNYRVQKLTVDGVYVTEWGERGPGDGQFLKPRDVAVGPITGNVYVSDEARGDIQVFSDEGWFIGKIGIPTDATTYVNGMLRRPSGIALSADETAIYVGDTWYANVTRYSTLTPALAAPYELAGEVEVTGDIDAVNGSFDPAIVGWQRMNDSGVTSTFTRVEEADAPDGPGFGRLAISAITAPQLNKGAFITQNNGPLPPVVPGNSYTISMWVRTSSPNIGFQFFLQWATRTGGSLQNDEYSPTYTIPANRWRRISYTTKAPGAAATFWYSLRAKVVVEGATLPANVDFDDVRIRRGVRYQRAANVLVGNVFSYQMVTDDMPALGKYEIRARGRDVNSAGKWSEPSVFRYVVGPTAIITQPPAGAVINVADPMVSWFLTSGVQLRYKVEIVDALTGVITYDSGWVTNSTTANHRVPAGYLSDGGTYLARVWIDDGDVEVMI